MDGDERSEEGTRDGTQTSPGSLRVLNRTVLVLLLLTAVTGIAAYVVYPKSTSVTVQGARQGIEVVGTTPLTAVDVEEGPDASGDGVTLAVSLRNGSAQTPEDGRLVVVVPSARWGSASGCAPNALVCTPDAQPGFKDAVFTFPGQWVDTGSDQSIARYKVHLSIVVSDVSPNLVQNPEYIATLLPPISVTEEQLQQHSLQYTAVPVNYSERVQGGENYTWKEGEDSGRRERVGPFRVFLGQRSAKCRAPDAEYRG